MYAIVDIETTGGHASANGITEVAILLHDGNQVTEHFRTLVNPRIPIPVYIQALTGINDEMLQSAPLFEDVAQSIFELLHDKIFVAHNVNFDFSFLHYHLAAAGYNLQTKKLCTVRLTRKIIPGLVSYSLGRLCTQLGIEITERHRAAGDAQATAILFSMLLEKDIEGHIEQALNHRSKEQSLPPHLPKEDIDKLPSGPGIYYFHNNKAKVVYVGKAINIRKRVSSHFSNNKPNRQKQEFLRDIHHISFQECGNELVSFILESIEIKRLWPAHNRSLKRFEHAYGLYTFEDQNGYLRIAIDKRRKFSNPVYTFSMMPEGYGLIKRLMNDFSLCPKLCFVQRNNDPCSGTTDHVCKGACLQNEAPGEYNKRVHSAVNHLKNVLPSFLLLDKGRNFNERSCILMENGQFYGMGYIPVDNNLEDKDWVKQQLSPYPPNDYVRNLIQNYALRYPEKAIPFKPL